MRLCMQLESRKFDETVEIGAQIHLAVLAAAAAEAQDLQSRL